MTDTKPTPPDTSDSPASDVNPQGVDLARKAGFAPDHKDAALVRIDAANLPGGEYSSDGADDSNPAKLEAMAAPAFWPSDKLDGGGQS